MFELVIQAHRLVNAASAAIAASKKESPSASSNVLAKSDHRDLLPVTPTLTPLRPSH